jgi:hypothetical protein
MKKILLLELDLTAAPAGRFHRLTTAMHDVEYEGYTWDGVGDLISVDDIQNTAEIASLGTTVTLSGIDPAYRQEIDQNGFKKAPIRILAADLEDNTNVITNAVVIHAGTCDTPITEIDYEQGTMTIGVSTVSIWGDLEKTPDLTRSSYATHSSIHSYNMNGDYEPDQFFKFVASTSIEEDWIS